MEKEFRLADPGEGIHEAEIVEVLVSEGDHVEEEQPVLVIETDKAATEVPSPMTGVIKKINVKEGDTVEVGDLLMVFEVEAEEAEEKEEAEKEKEETEEAEEKEEAEEAETEKASETEETEEQKAEEAERAAKKEEREEKKKAAEEKKEDREPEEKKEKEKTAKREEKRKPVPAVPSTRRVARELGVDLHEVEPSGPGGRVTTEDVKAYAEKQKEEKKPDKKAEKMPPEKKEKKRPASEEPSLPDFSQWGEVERISLRSVRRTTAKRMQLSWSEIPHVTHQDVADITDLETFRQNHKKDIQDEGGALTITIFVIKAAVAALKAYPRFNASLDMEQEEIILKHHYHVGLAVDTDRGLLVPVIREADRKSITDLAIEFPALAEKTRKGDVDRNDMTGGTFTITNIGSLGGTGFTPIINYPQAAILGMAKARLQPVVMGDMNNYLVKPRLMLPLVLAFDHRIADGADAARFMEKIVSALENPEKLMMLT